MDIILVFDGIETLILQSLYGQRMEMEMYEHSLGNDEMIEILIMGTDEVLHFKLNQAFPE